MKLREGVTGLALLGLFWLAGCQSMSGSAPLPTVVLEAASETPAAQATRPLSSGGGKGSASGNLAADREVTVSAGAAGRLSEVMVQVGDQVAAGQVLARVEGVERLNASLEAARLELLSARQARQALDEHLNEARAAAALRLARANDALDQAQKRRESRSFRRGSDSSIAAAQADLILASDQLKKAQEVYDSVSSQDDASVAKAGALSALAAAQKARDRAQANLNYLVALPDPLQVDLAEAELKAAEAEAQAARETVERLSSGPDAAAVELAEARIAAAQAQLQAAQAALADLEIRAPFAATVGALNVQAGEWVVPGAPMMVLLDLSRMRVKTSDLSERTVTSVSMNQSVRVRVKALGVEAAGRVTSISPLAGTLGGDVIYTVIILLDEIPPGALPGMSVDVNFE